MLSFRIKCYLLNLVVITNIFPTGGDEFGLNSQIELMTDMSNTCIDDLQTNIYLTFGMGVSDAVVIIISDNDLYPNCQISIYTAGSNESVYLIVVIEFPDHTEGPNNACQDSNSNIYIKEPTLDEEINVCKEVNKLTFGYFVTPVYSIISGSTNVSVRVVSKSLFETVKITATSARRLTQYERCDYNQEVLCMIANVSVCISRELLCDENINCGMAAINDEDVRICDEGRYKRLWLVVLGGTIMVIIIVFFLIHLLRTCLPAVPDSFFIFNEDEDNKLILLTKFAAPPESMRPIPRRQFETKQSSSFKFKSIPVAQSKVTSPIKISKQRKVSIEEEKNESIRSEELEVELESVTFKQELNKEKEEPKQVAPLELKQSEARTDLKKPEDVQKIKEYAHKRTSSKRPRFEPGVVHIVNYPDLSSYQEFQGEEQAPKLKEKKKKLLRKGQSLAEREQKDISVSEEKKRRK